MPTSCRTIRVVVWPACAALLLATACGGGKSSSSASGSRITLSPTSATLPTAVTEPLTATVQGASDVTLVWAVDGTTGGSTSAGTLSGSGTTVSYTTPATAGTHTVTATSATDGSLHGSCVITVYTSQIATLGSPIVKVTDSPYLAAGNGVTDDTAAIQRAVTAVSGTGGTVLIPAGTYLVNPVANSNAGIRLGSSMTLYLQAGAILQASTTSTSNYRVLMANGVNALNISGGTVIGNRTHNSITDTTESGFGLEVDASSAVVIQGMTASNCWADGFYVGYASSNVTLANVTATSNRRNGLSITSAATVQVLDSVFAGTVGLTENGTFVNGLGLDIEPNANEAISNLTVSGCTFRANAGSGLAVGMAQSGTSLSNIEITSNTFTGNGTCSTIATRGIWITSGASGLSILDNTLANNYGVGIELMDGADTCQVQGNTVTGTLAKSPTSSGAGQGILLLNTAGNTVTGNTVQDNQGCGILDSAPASGTANSITGNTVSGNGSCS